MPQIVVTIDGKTYRMACAEGEEAHLEGLAAEVDGRVTELRGSFGEIGDLRLTVMAAIMATDELDEARGRIAALERQLAEAGSSEADVEVRQEENDQRLVQHLLGVSDVIERITLKLERG
ncbi:cell division protein ZapA [Aureimonas pseudogalii]|uniref:Cell division protein ZapA n=1 Tax=Aureimonas pseudogalii TaxID=1744844 RepID=A0A7W6H6B8_9HYPH|nr:cell division protein ZapA [Aureimonas pseudogalii]MBB3999293.1 cell division protein ZapA [Aureimonas pseudogalii]